MKPESEGYLGKAQDCLARARINLRTGLGDDAGRNAYLAGYHAAQALIIEKTAKIAKTHSGARSEFAKIAKDDPRIDKEFPSFLGWAYDLKNVADYLFGPGTPVPLDRAADAIATATRFIECIDGILKGE